MNCTVNAVTIKNVINSAIRMAMRVAAGFMRRRRGKYLYYYYNSYIYELESPIGSAARVLGQLAEHLADRGDAFLHIGKLQFDAQPVLAGESVVLLFLHQAQDLRRLDRRLGHELELDRGLGGVDARDAERLAEDAQPMAFDQRAGVLRQWPE